jgi:hypothetical protein
VRAMSRRNVLTDILPGSVVAVTGFATIGWSNAPGAAKAAQTVQAVMVRPHRHEIVRFDPPTSTLAPRPSPRDALPLAPT